jgi:hypothetical protein
VKGLTTVITFAVKNPSSLYGNFVVGNGPVNLQPSRSEGFDSGDISQSEYESNGKLVSPVFIRSEDTSVDLGASVNESPVYINGTASKVEAYYVKQKQTLGVDGYIDAVKLPSGEVLLFYGGQAVADFTCVTKGVLNTASAWSNSGTVMIIGTRDESRKWRAPFENTMVRASGYEVDGKDDMYRLPMMVLSGVEYQAVSINRIGQSLNIFVKCTKDNNIFLGCYHVALNSLMYDGVVKCEYKDLSGTDADYILSEFLWRPLLMDSTDAINANKSWTEEKNLVKDGFNFQSSNNARSTDFFVRMIGPSAVKPDVVVTNDFGIISPFCMNNGILAVFYDVADGVRVIFSVNDGRDWVSFDKTLILDAVGAVMIGKGLFYITPSGIEFTPCSQVELEALCNCASQKKQGKSVDKLETDLEKVWRDTRKSQAMLIGSGSISSQRISGYFTTDCITKVFYYQDDIVMCLQSNDLRRWQPADNF